MSTIFNDHLELPPLPGKLETTKAVDHNAGRTRTGRGVSLNEASQRDLEHLQRAIESRYGYTTTASAAIRAALRIAHMEICRADNVLKLDPQDIEEDDPERYRAHLARVVEMMGGKSIKAKEMKDAWRKQRDAARAPVVVDETPTVAPAAPVAAPVTAMATAMTTARQRAEEAFSHALAA